MNTSIEKIDGETVFAVYTRNDEDAQAQLMMLTGQFLDMLDHVSRNHPAVITPSYLWDLTEDLWVMEAKHAWPKPLPG